MKRTPTEKINEVVAFVPEMPSKIRNALGNLSSLLAGAAPAGHRWLHRQAKR